MMSAPIEREDVAYFKNAVVRQMGLQFDDGKSDFLADVLRQRLDETGYAHAGAYLARMSTPEEMRILAERLAVSETYFFRNRDHFRVLGDVILSNFMRLRANTRNLQILSAGCATGDEAYSIAILLHQTIPDIARWNIKIRAFDIKPSMIERAKRGRYSAWALRDTNEEIKGRYFRPEGRDFVLDESIRGMVSFQELNLADDDPSFRQAAVFDVVFLRNVIMYFTPEVARAVVSRIGKAMASGGYLFLGHAETLRGISHDFHLCHTHETFYYQRRDGSSALESDPAGVPARQNFLPCALEPDVSWVDAIQRASERIASLAMQPEPIAVAAAAAESPAAVRPQKRTNLGGALELMKQERFADALEALNVLPVEAREDADMQLLHGVLLLNAGRLQETEQLCGKLLQADELNAGVHYLMALCREHGSDLAAASEHDHAAVYLDGAFAMPHFHLGLMARRKGDAETARRELASALPLLMREDASRILLFGGGFSRDALVSLCQSELHAAEGS